MWVLVDLWDLDSYVASMTTMISEVYDAFLAAGTPEDKARAAAAAVAAYDQRFTKIEGDLSLLRWMVGFNLALTVAVLFKLFIPH
jgi:hypothetical protein